MVSKRSDGHFDRRTFIGTGMMAGAGLALGATPLGAIAQDRRLATIGGTAKTQYGSVRGLLKDGVQQFFCVPYGAPTGGANRFMPPQKPAAWSGVKDHFEITWAAPIGPGGEEPAPVVTALNRKTPQSEDCLTVNVFTPGLDNRARPVMVWMHGGGFSAGSGNYLLYDGTNLAKKEDVVVVSVNHRLNIFGFLHLAGIGGEKWSRRDERRRAGLGRGAAVGARQHRELRRRSGSRHDLRPVGRRRKDDDRDGDAVGEGVVPSRRSRRAAPRFAASAADDASDGAERFLAKLGIAKNQLEQDPADRLASRSRRRSTASRAIPRLGNGPVIDGNDHAAASMGSDRAVVLGQRPVDGGLDGERERLGRAAAVRARRRRDAEPLHDAAREQGRGRRAEAARAVQAPAPADAQPMLWLMAESDDTRRWSAQLLCRLKAEQGTAASYLYFFDWQSPVHNNRMGSYHTLDIPFVFYNMDIGASMTGSAQARYELGHVMSAAWAAFARTGNPNHADMPNWPKFEPSSLPTMVFGDRVSVVNDPNKEERLALAALRAKRPS